MEFNIEELDISRLNLSGNYYSTSGYVKDRLDKGEQPEDDVLLWIIDPPLMMASAGADKERKQRLMEEAIRQRQNKPANLKIVRLLKAEFYDFMCTESDTYKRERMLSGGNINILIASLSSAIATKVSSSLEIGMVTSFVTLFFIICAKMGKRALCEYFKPEA